jgi:general secretion pathway protein J
VTGYQRGVTLLEMLVVMVIVSLVATMMMQGFGFTMGVYQRVVQSQKDTYREILVVSWLRQTLANLVSPRESDALVKGEATQISGLTFQPLVSSDKGKTAIQWRLAAESSTSRLYYRELDQEFLVYTWQQQAEARFQYMDTHQEWHDHWPPDTATEQQIPTAVRLSVGDQFYTVQSANRVKAEVFIDELLYGRE